VLIEAEGSEPIGKYLSRVQALGNVELHGLTPVAPLHALRRAETLRSVSSFAKATEDTLFAFIHGLTPVAFCEGG
jgi:hypothetical protein